MSSRRALFNVPRPRRDLSRLVQQQRVVQRGDPLYVYAEPFHLRSQHSLTAHGTFGPYIYCCEPVARSGPQLAVENGLQQQRRTFVIFALFAHLWPCSRISGCNRRSFPLKNPQINVVSWSISTYGYYKYFFNPFFWERYVFSFLYFRYGAIWAGKNTLPFGTAWRRKP